MKFEMAKNSLFAVLLRSRWWISFVVAIAVFAVARIFLPAVYAAFVPLPFIGIGFYAAWQQLRVPGEARVSETIAAIGAMSWPEFSEQIEAGFRNAGYSVKRVEGAGGDFEAIKGRRISLVSAKRWKAARVGIEPLRELDVARRAGDAHEAIYIAIGEITDQASAFAKQKNILVLQGAALVQHLPRLKKS
jgi:restriction system protein